MIMFAHPSTYLPSNLENAWYAAICVNEPTTGTTHVGAVIETSHRTKAGFAIDQLAVQQLGRSGKGP